MAKQQVITQSAYSQNEAKQRSVVGKTQRPIAYEDVNEKVRNKNLNLDIDPYGTLNIDIINNNNFEKVKGPSGIHINSKVQSKKNQSDEFIFKQPKNYSFNSLPIGNKTVLDIAKGMRLALGIPEPIVIPQERKASRQLTKVTSLNRPVANKRWSKEEIQKYNVYKV